MAHAQKPDFVFPRNGRVHLNRWGLQFSRLLAAEVCASAWVMLDRPRSEVAWECWLPTPFASFPFTSPPVRHRVPPGSERALLLCLMYHPTVLAACHPSLSVKRNQQMTFRRTYSRHQNINITDRACQVREQSVFLSIATWGTAEFSCASFRLRPWCGSGAGQAALL